MISFSEHPCVIKVNMREIHFYKYSSLFDLKNKTGLSVSIFKRNLMIQCIPDFCVGAIGETRCSNGSSAIGFKRSLSPLFTTFYRFEMNILSSEIILIANNFKTMAQKTVELLDALMAQYRQRKHPLDYQNLYQLVVMVLLSAQDSDKHINQLAPDFFKAYPSMSHLALAQPEDLHRHLSSVRNFGNKCEWLVKLAKLVGDDAQIPQDMATLTRLPGIGRKSANVILRESGKPAEGIIVDLHVVRVAPRIGIVTGTQPEKIEKQLMRLVSHEKWGEVGMAISFLGREICRPTNPKCEICVMNAVCRYLHGSAEEEGTTLF